MDPSKFLLSIKLLGSVLIPAISARVVSRPPQTHIQNRSIGA